MKFNWEDFKNGKIAVHCDTEEKAKDFVKECYKYGIKWLCEANYDATFWEKYENDTFYFGGFNLHMANISILSYGNYADVEDETVFEWELTPFYPELKEGMVVECRNGDRYLLRNVRGDLILSANKGWVEYVYDNNFKVDEVNVEKLEKLDLNSYTYIKNEITTLNPEKVLKNEII